MGLPDRGPGHPLTGERQRAYRGGFTSSDEAFTAAVEARKRLDSGLVPHAKRVRVSAFFVEWLASIRPTVKATTWAGYRNTVDYYVVPTLGKRWLSDLNVRTLTAFYRHLLDQGRIRSDTGTALYDLWSSRRDERGGYGPRPSELAELTGTTKEAARMAAMRFRRGRVPTVIGAGLSLKSVRNVHGVIQRALRDAVAWKYLMSNPAVHVVLPRASMADRQRKPTPWTVAELGRWLELAMSDRYGGLWVLAATTGMRRSELAGLTRSLLDLDAGVLQLEDTRVVVDGRPEDSDGKSAAGRRTISLDPFTVKHLGEYAAQIDDEAEAHGRSAPWPYLAVSPEGVRLHPDTITRRFNRLVGRAGVPRIRLHDVRHTYATMAMDAGVNPKLLSDRIGHANELVTLQIYTHRTSGLDRAMAEQLSALIEGAVHAARADVAASGQVLRRGVASPTVVNANPDTLPTPSDPTGPCPWCGRVSNFHAQGMHPLATEHGVSMPVTVRGAAVLSCYGCGKGTVVVTNHAGEGLHWYPAPGMGLLDPQVDSGVASAYDEGLKCLSIGANRAAAVMFRSALSLFVKDKGGADARAERHLKPALKHMKDGGSLHASLWDWADHLNQLGNEGAHPEDYDDVTAAEARTLGDFVRHLIRHEYEMPAQLLRARGLSSTE